MTSGNHAICPGSITFCIALHYLPVLPYHIMSTDGIIATLCALEVGGYSLCTGTSRRSMTDHPSWLKAIASWKCVVVTHLDNIHLLLLSLRCTLCMPRSTLIHLGILPLLSSCVMSRQSKVWLPIPIPVPM